MADAMAPTPALPGVPLGIPATAEPPAGHRATRPVAPAAPASWRAWAGLAAVVAARAYRAALVTLVVVATVPVLWSWSSHVIRTGSMEPTISTGDIVVAQPFSADEDVPVGRILVFRNPAHPESEQLLVHRIVSDRGDGTWTSRGDANGQNDATPVSRDDLQSRALLLVPFVGKPYLWVTGGAPAQLVLLGGWLLLTIAAFVVAGRRGTAEKTEEPDDTDDTDDTGTDVDKAAAPADEADAEPTDGSARRIAPSAGPGDPAHRAERTRSSLRRVASVVLAMTVVLAGAAAWSGTAGAAFTATTVNAGSGWTVSTSLATRVALTRPGDAVRGTVPLTATLTDSGGTVTAVRIDYAVAGTTTWRTICTDSTTPYSCSWVTTSLTNQEYDLRAVAVAGTTTHTSELVEDVTVDNTAPTVVLQDPGTPLRGTVTLTASAGDAHSGVDRVVVQYAATGTSTWRDVCTSDEEPATCRLDTTTLADGTYSFRAVATDEAGNSTTSTVVANRTVDNRVASVAVTDPGAFLSGTVQLTATANAPAGVASVRIQRAAAGTTTWTDVCTDTTSPYTCAWDTRLVANGLYDLRAISTDTAGRATTSATVTGRRVDNSPVRAADVQTTQGGASAGRLDQGDRVTFTYSGQVRPASLSAGWTGTALPVTLRLRDGNLVGTGSTGDTLDVLRNGAAVALGSVNLRQSYVRSLRTVQFAATMTATTVVVGGVSVTQVVVVLGAPTSSSGLSTVNTASAMTWTPSTTALDLAGRAVSATPVTETGASDREF